MKVTQTGAHPLVILDVNTGVGNAFTVIVCVAVSPQIPAIEYVIIFTPVVAKAGSNVPFTASIIPVPLQTPPVVAAVKLNCAASAHIAVIAVIVAFADGVTVTETVSTAPHIPEIVYVIICVPIPAIEASNVPPTPDVIPVPVHVPPPVTADKLNAGAPVQTDAG